VVKSTQIEREGKKKKGEKKRGNMKKRPRPKFLHTSSGKVWQERKRKKKEGKANTL